jgi:hypothetical protein
VGVPGKRYDYRGTGQKQGTTQQSGRYPGVGTEHVMEKNKTIQNRHMIIKALVKQFDTSI